MSPLDNSLLLGAAPGGGGGGSGAQISRSLRFNSADSAYLSRTPASAGNRKTWTWSGWVKIVKPAEEVDLLARDTHPNYTFVYIDSSGRFSFAYVGGGGADYRIKRSVALLRDTAAWYHLICAVDTTQAVEDDRIRLYINGSLVTQVTVEGGGTGLAQNTDTGINEAAAHAINYWTYRGTSTPCYLADIHFIDGQALTPASFGETNAVTGRWEPKAYGGTYGTNGFKLNFADNSAATAAALGKDTSGNGNNWTPTNLSVTAGAGNDSLVDTPTSYGTDTGVGGEVRGNYCTWNPVAVSNYGTVAWPVVNGALDANDNATSIYGVVPGTIAVSSGKWYWEITVTTGITAIDVYAGVGIELSSITEKRYKGSYGSCYYYDGSGTKTVGTANSAYGTAWTSGDVIGVALDLGAGTVTFYRNNTSQGAISITAGEYRPVVGDYNNANGTNFSANFGQRPFAYTAPSGFKALCDTNLPAPTIVKPSTVMDVILRNGFGTSGGTVTGLNFSPDLIWEKTRSISGNHYLTDSVRGTASQLYSNLTNAEGTLSTYVTAFNSNGYSMGSSDWATNNTVAAWCWDAGSSTVTNTSGTIQSSVRANASAGFSIVTYTGTGSAGSIGHGLGVAPKLFIVKNRSAIAAPAWPVLHTLTGGFNFLDLSNTGANGAPGQSAPNSSVVFNLGDGPTGANGNNYVMYCFAPVAGYSAFGSYTGNGNADGPFVYTGFRPRWVMIKRADVADAWVLQDTARDTYNVASKYVVANTADAEGASTIMDITSNGFKQRNTFTSNNASGGTYIYAAFAEFPFQYARAR